MGLWKVVISGTFFSNLCQNVLYFEKRNGTQGTEVELKNELQTNWIPIFQQLQNNAFLYTTLSVQDLGPPAKPAVIFSLVGMAGALSGAPAHSVLAGLFSLRTNVGGRKGHGRFYMPGVHGQSVLNNVLQPGAFNQYVASAVSLSARYGEPGSGPYRLILRSHGPEHTETRVTDIVVRQTFGIQRRRNTGVGG